jgi:hypothetical protein
MYTVEKHYNTNKLGVMNNLSISTFVNSTDHSDATPPVNAAIVSLLLVFCVVLVACCVRESGAHLRRRLEVDQNPNQMRPVTSIDDGHSRQCCRLLHKRAHKKQLLNEAQMSSSSPSIIHSPVAVTSPFTISGDLSSDDDDATHEITL